MKQITTPATIERVRALKRKLTEILKDLPEISPGICRFGEGYGVKLNVNVSGLEDFAKTVEFFRGIPCIVEVVGSVRALKKPASKKK